MNVSVAEVGHNDQWKSAQMAFVTVASGSDIVQKRLSSLTTILHSPAPGHVLIDLHTELL